MGIKDKLFGKREAKPVVLPAILEPEDPVNFDSVVDWMVGLSEAERKTVDQVVTIYRDANSKAAAALGVKEQPTSFIKPKKLTDKQIDDGLDGLLATDPKDLKAALMNEKPKAKKSRKVTAK